MSGWRIRAARLDEADAVIALEAQAFAASSWGASGVAAGLTTPNISTLIAFAEEAAAGFAFWRSTGEEAEILSIGVAPRWRRLGCARAIMEEIVRRAREDGVRKLFLEVDVANAPAAILYQSLGFEKIGRRKRYYLNGGDALVMRLNL